MFHFADRPYGGQFIAVCATDREAALARAVEQVGAARLGFKWDGDLYMCDSPEAEIAEGAFVSGGYQE
jgi:hypothetical protein